MVDIFTSFSKKVFQQFIVFTTAVYIKVAVCPLLLLYATFMLVGGVGRVTPEVPSC